MTRAGTLWIALASAVVSARAESPDAAAAVKAARAQEAWIARVDRFWAKANVLYERSPQGIAKRRRKLQEQFPGQPFDGFPDLEPVLEQQVEVAFDARRVRIWNQWSYGDEDLRVWDGKRFVRHTESKRGRGQNGYLIAPEAGQNFNQVWSNFSSFRTDVIPFWWISPDAPVNLRPVYGNPEDFAYAGRDQFDDTECDVYCMWGSWHRFYVSVADRRLRGLKEGAQTRPDMIERLMAFFRKEGQEFRDAKEFADWLRSRTGAEKRAIDLKLSKNMPALTEPIFEFGLEDYKEVSPGCWFPMLQTSVIRFIDQEGANQVDLKSQIRITEVHVDEPLPERLFEVQFQEGAEVRDETHKPPLTYFSKPSITDNKWAEIISAAMKRDARQPRGALGQSAMIGKPVPEFPPGATWVNSKALRWSELADRPVMLVFWAEWSGPSLVALRSLHNIGGQRGADAPLIVGVHPPGSDPDAIRRALRDAGLAGPTCVDVRGRVATSAWGEFSQQLGIDNLPHAVLVGRDRTVRAAGPLSAIISKARRDAAASK